MLTFKTNGRKGNIYSSILSGINLFVDKYCVWWNQTKLDTFEVWSDNYDKQNVVSVWYERGFSVFQWV